MPTTTLASSEKTTSSPPSTLVTDATRTPAMLPCATNATRTGKNAPASSPPTVNSSVPERSCESTRPTIQSMAWLDEFSAHSPVCDETVGYEPSLKDWR